MTRFTRLCGGRQLALSALLLSGCGLGAAGTTAQNNATSDPITTLPTPLTPTSTTVNGNDTTTPTGTTTGGTDSGTQTPQGTTTTPVTPAVPVAVPGTPATPNTVVTSPNTPVTTPAASDDLFNIKALRYSFFDYNEATGAFVLVMTDDGKFCLHRPLGLAEKNSHELKISATMQASAPGGAQQMTLSSLQATLTQLSAQCQPAVEATLQSGSFAVTSLTSTAASGNFNFQMAIAGMAPQPVAANFASTPCAGLRGGVPAIVTCL